MVFWITMSCNYWEILIPGLEVKVSSQRIPWVGMFNESGEALLSFCAVNDLTIMNTIFQRKTSHMAAPRNQEMALY